MVHTLATFRAYRDLLLSDPQRPGYHFAFDCNGWPADPNGAFYADGRYHLMYLYARQPSDTFDYKKDTFYWGHLSSVDLLHWRRHPDALGISNGDKGCFSGGAFVDEDGTAYLSFWKFAAQDPAVDRSGIMLAAAKPPYDVWERLEPIAIGATSWGILDLERDGKTVHAACADPSNIWKQNGSYYMLLGNKVVLDTFGATDPQYAGCWTELFRSRDLRHWEYVHRFYDKTLPECSGYELPDGTEDNMCGSFLPLYDAESGGQFSGKYLQLFISHNKGCQYFVGRLEGETFIPEQHGRFSHADNTFFAPEALVDSNNRQILWAWVRDNEYGYIKEHGWSGVYSFPRNVWYADGQLKMAPAAELERLQYNGQDLSDLSWTDGQRLPVKNGRSFRLRATLEVTGRRTGVAVLADPEGTERTEIYYDAEAGQLVMDLTRNHSPERNVLEAAPFALQADAPLELDIFVDNSVVEVYANRCQAICRRAFPEAVERCRGVYCLGNGNIHSLHCWEMDPANPY